MNIAIQVKRFVADYGPAIALVLVLLAAVCVVGVGLTYASPPAETVSVQTNEQSVSTSVGTSAVVTGETALYEENTRLHDMPVYYFSATPNVTLHVETNVPNDQPVTVSQRLVLHMSASRNGDQFWSERSVLMADKQTATDGVVLTNKTLNVDDLQALIADRRNEVGDVGQFDARLRLNVSYETDRYAGSLQSATSLVTTSEAYWFSGSLGDSRSHATTETQRHVGSPDSTRIAGFTGLGILSILAAGFIRQRYQDLDPRELELELTRSRYDEWISNGEIPTKSEKEYIRVHSLADLVDIAIDSNKRVVYDPEFDVYGVVAGDLVYHYSIGDENFTEWFDV